MILSYYNAVNFILMLLSSKLCSSINVRALSSPVTQLTSSSCYILIMQFIPISYKPPILSPTILLPTLYSYTLIFFLTDRPSLTSLQNSTKNYSSAYCNLYVFRLQADFERTGNKNSPYLIHY